MAEDTPAGFSSPMGGRSKKASAAAAAALNELKTSAKSYADNMERGAKAAERAARVQKGGASPYNASMLGQGTPTGGSTPLGGGARMPAMPGSPPSGLTPPPTAAGGGTRPIGGGARIPPSPGAGGTPGAPSYAETAARSAGLGAPARTNGGGASFGTAVGTAVGAGMASVVGAMPTYAGYDFATNRAAINSLGGYDKGRAAQQIHSQLGGGFANAAERDAQVSALNNGGFAWGSSQMATQTSSTRSIAMLDPTKAAAAGRIATSFQQPEMFNRMRMMGIKTMGEGGKPLGVNEISKNIYQEMAGRAGVDSKKAPSVANVAAYFGPGGSVQTTMAMNGANEEQISAVRDSMMASATAGKFITDKDATSRGKKNVFADSMLGGDQAREKGVSGAISASLKDFADGYIATQKTLGKTLEKLGESIDNLPGEMKKAFGLAGGVSALTAGGGVQGNIMGGLAAGGAMSVGRAAIARRTATTAAATAGRMALPALGAGAGLGALGAGPLAAVGAGLFAGYAGIKGIMGADTSEGRFSKRAWQTAWEAGAGGLFGYKAPKKREEGDGPGGSHGSSFFQGNSGGRFRGEQWGAEVGDNADAGVQNAAAKKRGSMTYEALAELMKGGPPHRITSDIRKGKSGVTATGRVSYHSSGHALDIAGPTPVGKGQKGSPALLAINKYLAQYGEGLNELIYSGPGGTQINNGKPHTYTGVTKANHYDHVHVAATPGMLKRLQGKKGGGPLSWLKKTVSGAVSAVANVLGVGKPAAGRGKSNGSASGTSRGGSGSSVARGGQGSQGAVLASILSGLGDNRNLGYATHDPDPSEASVGGGSTSAAAPKSDASAIEKYLYALRSHESGTPGGDYKIENGSTRGAGPRGSGDTSASGAYQYLDSTWNKYKGYGFAADAPPAIQDERARQDSLRAFEKYGNWREVAAAHFRGGGWVNQHRGGKGWDEPAPSNNGMTTNKFIDKVLGPAGIGDGPGSASVGMAASVQADVPSPRSMRGMGGGGNMTVHSRGGSSISIGKVEVHLTSPQVSPTEARRIGKMVVDEIASQARMKEMSR